MVNEVSEENVELYSAVALKNFQRTVYRTLRWANEVF